MNYSSMPEFPPIGAYEDDKGSAIVAGTPPVTIAFAKPASPFWRINDGCDWIERDLPQREWIVPQYVMRRKVTGLIGAPEAGKSGLALKWAISLALNVPFGEFAPVPLPGEQPRARRVMILNAEDDEDEQRRRISSMIQETGCSVPDLTDNLIRVGPDSGTAKLFEGDGSGEVYPTAAFDELKGFIKERKVDVLILDPLVELLGGQEENSNGVMGGVFALLRGLAEECKIAVIVIHHTKKGIAVPGNLEAARGGSALGGSIRIGLTLTVMTEAEAADLGIPKDRRKHYVRLDNAKQSYGPPSDAALWFHRYSVELENGDSSPALEPWSPPKAKEMSVDDLTPISEAVKLGAGRGLPYSLKLSSEGRSIKHLLEAKRVTGKAAQDRVIEALRDKCGMVNAQYQRRNDEGQKRGTGWGARIGRLPSVEWLDPTDQTPGSGDDND